MKKKPIWTDINPKAVTTDELFGFLHPATREWKDGTCGRVFMGVRFGLRFISVDSCQLWYVCVCVFVSTFECVLCLSIAMRNHMSHQDLKQTTRLRPLIHKGTKYDFNSNLDILYKC